jgi:hypothetical protein
MAVGMCVVVRHFLCDMCTCCTAMHVCTKLVWSLAVCSKMLQAMQYTLRVDLFGVAYVHALMCQLLLTVLRIIEPAQLSKSGLLR